MAFPERSTADRIQSSVTRHVAGEEARRKRRLAAIATVGVAALIGLTAVAVSLAKDEPKSGPSVTSSLARDPPVASPAPIVPVAPPPGAVSVASVVVEPNTPSPSPSPSPSPVRLKTPAPAVEVPRPTATPARPAVPPASTEPVRPSDEFGDPWKKR